MYRPSTTSQAQPETHAAANPMVKTAFTFALSRVPGWINIFEQAWREHRARIRAERRTSYFIRNRASGLNGARAMERRKAQIDRGQLTASNGLVSSLAKAV